MFPAKTEEGVKMSEDIMRYSILGYVLSMRNLSAVRISHIIEYSEMSSV